LLVDVPHAFRFRQRLLWRFFVAWQFAGIKASVTETGRGRGVKRGTVRVFGPGYNRSFKWLVAP